MFNQYKQENPENPLPDYFQKHPSKPNDYLLHLINTVKHIPVDADDHFWIYFEDYLYKFRHDAVHRAFSQLLYDKFIPELPIQEIFPTYTMEKCLDGHLTPDIVYIDPRNNNIFIIEISIAKALAEREKDKIMKYQNIIDGIRHINPTKNVIFYPLIIFPDLKNLDVHIEWFRKNGLFNHKFEINNYILNCHQEFMSKLEYCRSKVNNDYRNKALKVKEPYGIRIDTCIPKELIEDFLKNNPQQFKYGSPEVSEQDLINLLRNNVISDKNLFTQYADMRNNTENYVNASIYIKEENEKITPKYKPSHHIVYPFFEKIEKLEQLHGESCEQYMTYNFLNYVIEKMDPTDDRHIHFLFFLRDMTKSLRQCLDKSKNKNVYRNIFEKGFLFSESEDKLLKKEYHDLCEKKYDSIKKQKKDDGKVNFSFWDFLGDKGLIDNEEVKTEHYIKHQKSIKMKHNLIDSYSKNFIRKSGINYYKNGEHLVKKEKMFYTTPFLKKNPIDTIIKKLKEETDSYHCDMLTKIINYCTTPSDDIPDHPDITKLKNILIDDYKKDLDKCKGKTWFNYLWFCHLVSSQLMHNIQQTRDPYEFSFFNCGVPNWLTIVGGGYNNHNENNSKPYFTMIITSQPDDYTTMYGDLMKIRLKGDNWLIVTKWFRLPVYKFTHIRDSFYSVLSTTMCDYNENRDVKDDYINEMSAIKSLIATTTNQQACELLMDMRYAYMSAFSSHTNIGKLLKTKFAPPYHDHLCTWIVERCINNLCEITKTIIDGSGVTNIVPDYASNRRITETIGGKVNIPSLWTKMICNSIDMIMEEAFIYVLTLKEPSCIYHEKINAINTILNYQRKYDEQLPEYSKGYFEFKNVNDFLSNRLENDIGFSRDFVYHSFTHLLNIIKPDYNKIINEVLSECFSVIVSTKAVIHSIEREYEPKKYSEASKVKRIRLMNKLTKSGYSLADLYDEEFIELVDNKSTYYKNKERQKVWETSIDLLEESIKKGKEIFYVEDAVRYFLDEQKGKVIADICIKSQYGSKREFYVINLGAKAMGRIIETFFKKICLLCETECISVPGDKKMDTIQKSLNRATEYAKENSMRLRYVNGDCTKWSAAESMGTFVTMCDALKQNDNKDRLFFDLLKIGFLRWADKDITIPREVLYCFRGKNTKDYLKNNQTHIHSTQNFLQGMFNYASSLKASACNYYTNYLWSILSPHPRKDDFKCWHMEHSDDYAQIIVYNNEIEFENYRSFFKMCMKLSGYNDSDRKTNCQSVFLEFVSLISFNGQMIYPKIKKTKEVNLSLPCTGYKTDIEAGLSRQGECMRMGCSNSFCYFFQRLHNYCIRDAYSLLPGQKNDLGIDEYKVPIEWFGTPDQYPLLTMLCKGNVNNYRLYQYGGDDAKKMIVTSFVLAQNTKDNDLVAHSIDDYTNRLYHPRYSYMINTNILRTFKHKFKLSDQLAMKYWEDKPAYKILKPNDPIELIKWLKIMFMNRSFIEAYVSLSRTQMTLRLSGYVKGKKLLKALVDQIWGDNEKPTKKELKKYKEEHMMTIKESFIYMYKNMVIDYKIIDEKYLKKIIMKSDPTCFSLYNMFDNNEFITMKKQPKPQVGSTLPYKPTFYHVENDPGIVLQYMLNMNDFKKDRRIVKSELSLQRDINTIVSIYGDKIDSYKKEIQVIYNDLALTKNKKTLYVGYSYGQKNVYDTLREILMYNFCYDIGIVMSDNTQQVTMQPNTGNLFYYHQRKNLTETNLACLCTLTLQYVYFRNILGLSLQVTREQLNNFVYEVTTIDKRYTKKMDYHELLCQFNETTLRDDNETNYLKMAAYLQFDLLGDPGLLIKISSKLYTYTYNYTKMARKYDNKYEGETNCLIKFANFYFEMKQQNEENPTMYTDCTKINIVKLAYLVTLKLGHIINFDTVLEAHLKYNVDNYLIKKTLKNENKDRYLCNVHGKYRWVNKEIINYPYLPIIFKNNIKKTQLHSTNKVGELNPIIDIETLTVKINNNKLFKLPFWICEQNIAVKCIDPDKTIEGITTAIWLKNKLFEKIVNNKMLSKYDIKDFKMDNSTELFLLDKLNNKDIHSRLSRWGFKESSDEIKKLSKDIVLTSNLIFVNEDDTSLVESDIYTYLQPEKIDLSLIKMSSINDIKRDIKPDYDLIGKLKIPEKYLFKPKNPIKKELKLINIKACSLEDEDFYNVKDYEFFDGMEERWVDGVGLWSNLFLNEEHIQKEPDQDVYYKKKLMIRKRNYKYEYINRYIINGIPTNYLPEQEKIFITKGEKEDKTLPIDDTIKTDNMSELLSKLNFNFKVPTFDDIDEENFIDYDNDEMEQKNEDKEEQIEIITPIIDDEEKSKRMMMLMGFGFNQPIIISNNISSTQDNKEKDLVEKGKKEKDKGKKKKEKKKEKIKGKPEESTGKIHNKNDKEKIDDDYFEFNFNEEDFSQDDDESNQKRELTTIVIPDEPRDQQRFDKNIIEEDDEMISNVACILEDEDEDYVIHEKEKYKTTEQKTMSVSKCIDFTNITLLKQTKEDMEQKTYSLLERSKLTHTPIVLQFFEKYLFLEFNFIETHKYIREIKALLSRLKLTTQLKYTPRCFYYGYLYLLLQDKMINLLRTDILSNRDAMIYDDENDMFYHYDIRLVKLEDPDYNDLYEYSYHDFGDYYIILENTEKNAFEVSTIEEIFMFLQQNIRKRMTISMNVLILKEEESLKKKINTKNILRPRDKKIMTKKER